MKDKKGITISNVVKIFLDYSNRKLSKIWADKGSRFYNRPMKLLLQDNDIKMYSAYNEGKHVVVERFIRTFDFNIEK